MLRACCCPAGCAAIQIAKQVGATIYTTSSSKEKLDECKKLGADVLINYKEEDFSEIVRSKANPDAVLEVRRWRLHLERVSAIWCRELADCYFAE